MANRDGGERQRYTHLDPEQAYAEARRVIAEAARGQASELKLDDYGLTRIPPEIAGNSIDRLLGVWSRIVVVRMTRFRHATQASVPAAGTPAQARSREPR